VDAEAALQMLRDAKRELSDARLRVAHLEQVIDGLTGLLHAEGLDVTQKRVHAEPLPGMDDDVDMVRQMRPREAVQWVLRSRPGYPMSARNIFEYLAKRELLNPEISSGVAAYDMALRRLAEERDSGIEREGDTNRFVFRRAGKSGEAIRGIRVDSKGRVVRGVRHAGEGSGVRGATSWSDGRVAGSKGRGRLPDGTQGDDTARASEISLSERARREGLREDGM